MVEYGAKCWPWYSEVMGLRFVYPTIANQNKM